MSYDILYTLVSFATFCQYLLSAHCLPDTARYNGGQTLCQAPALVLLGLLREADANPTAIQMNVQPSTVSSGMTKYNKEHWSGGIDGGRLP